MRKRLRTTPRIRKDSTSASETPLGAPGNASTVLGAVDRGALVDSHLQPTGVFTVSPDRRNANRGTSRGRRLLRDSLRSYGACRSILADRYGQIIAGNKTAEAALELNVPLRVVDTDGGELIVVRRTDLSLATDDQAKLLAIADNRIAELNLDWDENCLKQFHDEGVNLLEFWSPEEFEALLGEGLHKPDGDVDKSIAPRPTNIAYGDLFELGSHRLLCGDATNPHDVTQLLDGQVPILLLTDPPYGVDYEPAWRHRLNTQQYTTTGAVLNDDRVDWREAFDLFPGDVAYVWHAGLHAGAVATALQAATFEIRSQIIWRKQHFVMSRGSYHWQHEPAWFAVRRGSTSHWRGDRAQTTVWDVPNLNPMGGRRDAENPATGHGTQKPVRLFEIPILNHLSHEDSLMDPFAGSGTALIAAEKTGRRALCMELDPRYVQVTIDRWEALFGGKALLISRQTGGR